MLSRFKALTERGDTIVEVMVVLAVLGLAIGIAYATANRSLLNARQAQESSEATELVQSQAEALRALSSNSPTDPDNPSQPNPNYIYQTAFQSTPFCIDSSGNVATGFTGSNVTDYSVYPVSGTCLRDSLYHLSISYSDPSFDTFTIKAIWDDVRGDGQDSVTLVYRVHGHET